jgi:hypothetical protein
VAFAGDRGIRQVEVSADGGATWSAAALQQPTSPTTWTFWQLAFQPKGAGPLKLAVRAVDGTGQAQTSENAETFPSGSTGYHQINVEIQ